eukprot:TRINITY_DN21748_c0_g1_i5.p1 TRINITY_DN21748_c0_g1~~TRINITY_DN21748_c0_g1_i5.p1  ORF type:complete len:268 (+),score=61.48 TRINITY_DN21748_c0_g1_i5:78-881(+)
MVPAPRVAPRLSHSKSRLSKGGGSSSQAAKAGAKPRRVQLLRHLRKRPLTTLTVAVVAGAVLGQCGRVVCAWWTSGEVSPETDDARLLLRGKQPGIRRSTEAAGNSGADASPIAKSLSDASSKLRRGADAAASALSSGTGIVGSSDDYRSAAAGVAKRVTEAAKPLAQEMAPLCQAVEEIGAKLGEASVKALEDARVACRGLAEVCAEETRHIGQGVSFLGRWTMRRHAHVVLACKNIWASLRASLRQAASELVADKPEGAATGADR